MVAEAAGGAVLALVVTVALAAGVLTVAAAVAEGVDDTETFAEAATLRCLRNAWEPVCLCRHGERQAPYGTHCGASRETGNRAYET